MLQSAFVQTPGTRRRSMWFQCISTELPVPRMVSLNSPDKLCSTGCCNTPKYFGVSGSSDSTWTMLPVDSGLDVEDQSTGLHDHLTSTNWTFSGGYVGRVNFVAHKYTTIFIYICRINTTSFNDRIGDRFRSCKTILRPCTLLKT